MLSRARTAAKRGISPYIRGDFHEDCLPAPCSLPPLATPALAASDITLERAHGFPGKPDLHRRRHGLYRQPEQGAVYRAAPGEATAEPFISKQAGNFGLVLGVLADSATDTLWVCDDNGDHAYLKTFSLKAGSPKKTYELPGGGFCNDIALKGSDAYITDTKDGRILKLAGGSDALTVWYTNDKSDPSLDGLVWQGNAALHQHL